MSNIILKHDDCVNAMKQCPFQFDLILTDPPYNISQDNNFSTMTSAERQGIDFGEWDKDFDVLGWIEKAFNLIKDNGSLITFCSYRYLSYIIDEIERLNGVVKDVMIWQKSNPMPRNRDRRYVVDTEFMVRAVKSKKAKWTFNRDQDTPYLRPFFYTGLTPKSERFTHPTAKPVALMEQLLKIHSNENDWVLDCFMGVGATGVACQNLKRNFVGIEISKEYYDIAYKRLEVNNA